MTFNFDLQPSDYTCAVRLHYGGWTGIWKVYAAWGAAVGAVVATICLGLTRQPEVAIFGLVASWVIYCFWGINEWRRRSSPKAVLAGLPWMFSARQIILSDAGVESAGDQQRSFHAWPLITAAYIGPSVTTFTCASGLLVILPVRAVHDRSALVEHLRSKLGTRLILGGCPRCGYPVAAGRGTRCPECGTEHR